jgi:acetylornithine deacetylase
MTSAFTARQHLRDAVAERRPALVDLAAQLVRLPTLAGAEEPAQRLIDDRLRAAGFDVTRVHPDASAALADPCAGYPALPYDERSSVVGRLAGSGGGRSLHLNGHVDVVPVEDPERWQHDPWGGEVSDGRLWGRGAGDMKAGLAACVIAGEIVAAHCPDRRGDLIVSSVIEEETGGNGMWSVLRAGHDAEATLCPEPTGLRREFAGTGVVWAKLTARSTPTHAMSAGRRGAFDDLANAVAALRRLEAQRNSPPKDEVFAAVSDWPFGTSVGMIEGGVWTASTPAALTAHVRIGFGRDSEPADVQRAVVEAVAEACEDVSVDFTAFRARACRHDPDAPWPLLVGAAHEAVTGRPAATGAATATSDMRYVTGQCLNYGPTAGGLHGTDEWVDLDSLQQATTAIVLAAARWLTEE